MATFSVPQPEKYGGRRDHLEIENFLTSLRGYLEFHEVADAGNQSVRYAKLFLRDQAQTWYSGLPKGRDGDPESMDSLESFEEALRLQFRPQDHVERVRAQLRSARQRGADVGRFIDYLDNLFMQLGDEIADSEKLDRFKSGLTGRERDFVYFSRPQTYAEAKSVALSIAGAQGVPVRTPLQPQPTQQQSQQTKRPTSAASSVRPSRPYTRSMSASRPVTCYLCGQEGHMKRDCTERLAYLQSEVARLSRLHEEEN
mmetsp:Transcript_14200/g.20644  ORF Transcript_14200/g.20644 Transcript_14200/m.20644 type:complete len:256 (-) Transcript_14200:244-1011(-)